MIMETCPQRSLIGLYHDGELPENRRPEVEQHLAQCPQCSAELVELRRLSQVLSIEARPVPPRGMKDRLHRHVDSMTDSSVQRFAQLLSGLAAAVLVMASLWLRNSSDPDTELPPPWEQAAATLRPQPITQVGFANPAVSFVNQLQPRNRDE